MFLETVPVTLSRTCAAAGGVVRATTQGRRGGRWGVRVAATGPGPTLMVWASVLWLEGSVKLIESLVFP